MTEYKKEAPKKQTSPFLHMTYTNSKNIEHYLGLIIETALYGSRETDRMIVDWVRQAWDLVPEKKETLPFHKLFDDDKDYGHKL